MKEVSEIYEEFTITRLLCFLETAPQSNKYQQILLNKDEFNKFSQSLGTVTKQHKNGKQDISIRLSEEVYELPDLQEIKNKE